MALSNRSPTLASVSSNEAPWYCPALAGPTIVDNETLEIRLPSGTLSVQAPPAYLQALVALCDGTRPTAQVLAELPETIDRDKFAEFLAFLTESEAIVDGNLLTAQALHFGRQLAPFGESAPQAVIDAISRRFAAAGALVPSEDDEVVEDAPWMRALNARISSYTFDERRPVTVRQLSAWLWSLCGIVELTHPRIGAQVPRRTVASAGALYTIEAWLVLQHQVGRYAPGLYRVRYPGPRRVALDKLGDRHDLLPRMFAQPWQTRYATGALILTGDVPLAATKYRNRSVQYLFSEAGAAFQNAGLAATELGLGMAQLGCYHESTIEAAFNPDAKTILGTAVFGTAPTQEQLGLARASPAFDFSWPATDALRYAMPGHLACARLKRDTAGDYAWGVDADPRRATTKALAETIERLGWQSPATLQLTTATSLGNVCDVSTLTGYSAGQYADPEFPFVPFAPTREYWWASGVDVASGNSVHVPADLVYSHAGLVASGHASNTPLTWSTTSGCAAATSLSVGIERALLELVERDAFMRHWLAQRAGTVVAPGSIPGHLRARVRLMEDAGCRVCLQWLPSPWGAVILATASHDEAGFTTLGAAAAPHPEEALERAICELESRIFVWLNGLATFEPITPDAVRTPTHHFVLYTQRNWYRHAEAFLMAQTGEPASFSALASQIATPLTALASRMAARGLAPFYVDITPSQNAIDQGRTPLRVVRAFIPTLVPLSFGSRLEPHGLVDHIHPDARFPHPFP
ncbi:MULTISPECIES: YcaO-like family protein [unclassified Cupriavidus]|uniref:YcaO-like family protein n=1 Tax=Cupriavidus sp. H19C3 TaxID=3241603 RepID=UPI003BF774BD